MSKNLLEQFENYLLENLPQSKSFHPIFEKALQEMLSAGGKRFRPMLLLSIVNAEQSLLLKNAMPVALGLELLHTYSLIHDDLPAMDDADLRRGYPTLHKTYDEVTAILVGDALNTHSFNLIANAPLSAESRIELVKILSSDEIGQMSILINNNIDQVKENIKVDNELIKNKKPFLGVCLGMQLISKKSYENGETTGLGWVDAEVVKFDFVNTDKKLKIPHVGWNNVSFQKNNILFSDIEDNSDFYFVHSYHFTSNEDVINSTTDYGIDFISSVNKDNIFAFQFHPEKSQEVGLKILKNFVDLEYKC